MVVLPLSEDICPQPEERPSEAMGPEDPGGTTAIPSQPRPGPEDSVVSPAQAPSVTELVVQ